MNFKRFHLASAIALCLTPPPSFASRYAPCDGCTDVQMQQAAISSGAGVIAVGDIANNRLVTFRVYVDGTSRNVIGQVSTLGTPVLTDVVIANSPEDLSGFSNLRSFYHTAPIGYHKKYNLHIMAAGAELNDSSPNSLPDTYSPHSEPAPGTAKVTYPVPGTNVYDVINSGPSQNQFLSWFGKQTVISLSNSMTKAVKAVSLIHITDPSALPEVSATVTFQDGSHIGVYLDASQNPAQLVINPKPGVDSHGNNVPASHDTAAGGGRQDYDYRGQGNSSDLGRMRQQLMSLGLRVPVATEWVCTQSDTNEDGYSIQCYPIGGVN